MRSKKTINKSVENKAKEILLLKTGKRGIIRMIFGRTGIVIALLLIQSKILFNIFKFLETLIPYAVVTLAVFTVIMVVYVVNAEHSANVKLTWIILIMLLPVFGSILYIFIQKNVGHRTLKRRLELVMKESEEELEKQDDLINKLKMRNKGLYNLTRYTENIGAFPIYKNSLTKYFPLGEDAFKEMLIQLRKAKKFIFLEYFIIDEGYMWGKILKILSDKVKEGVEVRVMYDGTCEFTLLPHNYPEKLKKLGIQCKVFAPIRPFISTHYNYRDHRKILVIDGQIAFTGGINLADEYINKKEVYGHWKDTAIMVKGDSVDSFTLMFLQMWNINEKYRTYMTEPYKSQASKEDVKGYVLPFSDSPLDNEKLGQMVYMDILNRAENYVHIMTPYLIIDDEMQTALQFAAKRGVDVKIIMPHIPDKKFVFAQSRSYYKDLIKAGVKIYEYTPGFMHAKVFVSDDLKAVIGTINLDYRSLYHHFECGVYIEEGPTILDIERDFLQTLNKSQKVTMVDIKKYNILMTIIAKILKLIAPLM